MKLVSCDVGTTHCKAGLFDLDGTACCVAMRPTPVRRRPNGRADLDPDETWETVTVVLREAIAAARGEPVAAIGIASMAETGLLVDRRTGQPKSPLIPWFDTSSMLLAAEIARRSDPFELFRRTGLRPSYKAGLAKVLWLREQEPAITSNAVWLSTADFIAHRLTGSWATDPTLAVRTLAYRIDTGRWDAERLADFGLSPDLFPPILPGGEIMGETTPSAAAAIGLTAGVPVAVCGHDHLCAALAVGAIEPGIVLDSMGTAEALIGALPFRPLTRADFESGLTFGPHVVPGRLFWMAALAAAGGSLDWLRAQLGSSPLSYEELAALLAATSSEPTDLLYFPYLLGAQAPRPDPAARGAFIGLTATHTRGDLIKAVLQGIAYEATWALYQAEKAVGTKVESLRAVGGGTRVPTWLQIKADVSGRPVDAVPQIEATLLGAAILAGIGVGVYNGESPEDRLAAARAALVQPATTIYRPDPVRRRAHDALFELYLMLQEPIRRAAAALPSIPLRDSQIERQTTS